MNNFSNNREDLPYRMFDIMAASLIPIQFPAASLALYRILYSKAIECGGEVVNLLNGCNGVGMMIKL